MLDANASIIEKLLAPIRDAIAATPKPRDEFGEADRLAVMGVQVQDLRRTARSDALARGRAHGTRPVEYVSALCLHQTAVGHIGPGNPRLTGIPAGAVVHQDGTVSLLHDFTNVVWHGHALNRFSWGIELDCREPGIAGLERTFWRSSTEKRDGRTMQDLVVPLTDRQISAAVTLGEWAADELARRGGRLRALVAHRQGHSSRTSDPGSRAWQGIAEPLRKALGLEDWATKTWGSGRPLPDVWTGASRGTSYS